MTVLLIVVLLAAGAFFAAMFNHAIEDNDAGGVILCLMFALTFMGLGAFVAYEHGTGELCGYPLGSNSIYETLSSVPDGAGKYAVILKEQDGSLSAYVLVQDPPKMFKVKNSAHGAQMLEPFPSVPPDPSVPSKK